MSKSLVSVAYPSSISLVNSFKSGGQTRWIAKAGPLRDCHGQVVELQNHHTCSLYIKWTWDWKRPFTLTKSVWIFKMRKSRIDYVNLRGKQAKLMQFVFEIRPRRNQLERSYSFEKLMRWTLLHCEAVVLR